MAAHYFGGQDIEKTCFIFPNRRSLVFFTKYLGGLVRERPLMAPAMYTINDFFYKVYKVDVTDRLRLLLELYDCYKALNPQAEPLDDFIFWGEVMLGDFDDIDKYLVDAGALLRNVSEFKSIQPSYDYLSETQKEAIEHFLAHFRDGHLKDQGVKQNFVKLWNILLPLYTSFNEKLRSKDIAYEGMVYRSLAMKLKEGESVADLLEPVFPGTVKYVFVGLNALNECERLLLKRMRDAGMAEFVWDYVSYMIKDPANKSSFFMKRNVEEFPQAFPIDPAGLSVPKITVVNVPSSVGQAKLAPWILSQTSGDPVQTAFVLPDENLLLPLLNSIPPSYDNVNVTMGYPMAGSAVYTLLDTLGKMQLRMRKRPEGWYFYHAPVRELFASGLFRELLSEEEKQVLEKVKADAKYYIPLADLQGGPVLSLVFRPVLENGSLESYFSDIVALVGRTLTGNSNMLLELDFAKRCHTQLNILKEINLDVRPETRLRIIERILQGISVPFKGEPLKGLQVMGPLETRALDFRYLVIMSAGEGLFPRRSVASSFIPPELRKGFGLPTYEFQDAVWAYYFYRMIQRPEHVWLVYDSRTEGLKAGEESRYIKQLEYHYNIELERLTSAAPLSALKEEDAIAKTAEHIDVVRGKLLSATSLKNYMDCPARFYYQVVEGLKTEDEIAESLDSKTLGTVYHAVMEQLYGSSALVTVQMLDAWIKDEKGLKALVRSKILEQMRSIEVSGRNLVLEEVILDYVLSTLKHDYSLLTHTDGTSGFKIIGLEKHLKGTFEGFQLHGYADRIDSYRPGEVRIIDYKTGKVDDLKSSSKIALQLFVYDWLIHQDPAFEGARLVNAIYSISHLYTDPLPEMQEDPEVGNEIKAQLEAMLSDITNLSVPWTRTPDHKACQWCDFKDICGR